ncbi:HPr Serine kinase C-terminal domain-containing protein [Rhizobium sp. NFR07]|uniref:HPr kinase/phosphorylase n=1 Tax=Rhizobium sp. NFR07 TaxID=1566262 RepID=UPI0008F1FCA2|nr:serine kinase [Rhizobium sp. NFR07]SFB54635.1 HPr Serine kinase C-terminal domain-containing protein [Rhizobium sp. NFR07]
MTPAPRNIHATAIVIGNRGLLFVGPPGIGKSMMAFTCLAVARRENVRSLLIADDQVFINRDGDRIVATCPPAIAGMMELRGSGIVAIDNIAAAPIDLAIRVISLADCERLPPESEEFQLENIGALPLVRIANTAMDPLAVIGALVPGWRSEAPFW